MTLTHVPSVLHQRQQSDTPTPPPNTLRPVLLRQLRFVLPPPSPQSLCHRLLRIRLLRSPTPLLTPTHPWIQKGILQLYPTPRRERNRRLPSNLPLPPLHTTTSMYLTRTLLSPPFRLSFPPIRWNSYPTSLRLSG